MPRIIFFSDVHGNLEALERVLDDVRVRSPDRIICLGDLTSYNADQEACMERITSMGVEWIAGNHDLISAQLLEPLACSPDARYSAVRARGALSARWRSHIRSLPLMICEEEFVAFHASPNQVDVYLSCVSRVQQAASLLRTRNLCGPTFFGHTHDCRVWTLHGEMPKVRVSDWMKLEPNAMHLVNVGTVGEPRNEDRRATYVTYDTDTRELQFCRLEYDIARARRKSEQGGWRRARHTTCTRCYDHFRCNMAKVRHLLVPLASDDSSLQAIAVRQGSALAVPQEAEPALPVGRRVVRTSLFFRR